MIFRNKLAQVEVSLKEDWMCSLNWDVESSNIVIISKIIKNSVCTNHMLYVLLSSISEWSILSHIQAFLIHLKYESQQRHCQPTNQSKNQCTMRYYHFCSKKMKISHSLFLKTLMIIFYYLYVMLVSDWVGDSVIFFDITTVPVMLYKMLHNLVYIMFQVLPYLFKTITQILERKKPGLEG